MQGPQTDGPMARWPRSALRDSQRSRTRSYSSSLVRDPAYVALKTLLVTKMERKILKQVYSRLKRFSMCDLFSLFPWTL